MFTVLIVSEVQDKISLRTLNMILLKFVHTVRYVRTCIIDKFLWLSQFSLKGTFLPPVIESAHNSPVSQHSLPTSQETQFMSQLPKNWIKPAEKLNYLPAC